MAKQGQSMLRLNIGKKSFCKTIITLNGKIVFPILVFMVTPNLTSREISVVEFFVEGSQFFQLKMNPSRIFS